MPRPDEKAARRRVKPVIPAAVAVLAAALTVVIVVTGPLASSPALARTEHGRLYTVDGYRVLELTGTPEQMGRAHGELLGEEIRRVVRDVLDPEGRRSSWPRIEEGVRVMERYQPERYRREMRALAAAAGVDYMKIVALQLFGDAGRGVRSEDFVPPDEDLAPVPDTVPDVDAAPADEDLVRCTNYAVFGPATETGELIVGRNFDYFNVDVAEYASIIIHYRPEGKRSFVTLTWSGVVNGWTLMNDRGLCAANNTAYHLSDSLEGISTCFLQRLIVENAPTVEIGIEIARRGPRACGTAMLLAGRTSRPTTRACEGEAPWTAVELEFDHEDFVVRKATDGYVMADNGFRILGCRRRRQDVVDRSRYGRLLGLIRKNHGDIDRTMNFAAARGVPLASINLHSALLFPSDQTFAVSMGEVPACRERYRRFRVTAEGIVGGE
jgi:hypothetical protein